MTDFSLFMSDLIGQNFFIAPLIAFLAGILSSTAPCSLSSIPLVIGYMGGVEASESPRIAFKVSMIFSIGQAATFALLGVIASLAGNFLGGESKWFYLFLGILLSMMALQLANVFNFLPSMNLIKLNKKRGMVGAFIAGMIGGFFSSPCSTPVLVVILGIIAKTGNLALGILLMLTYSIGHNILVILAGTYANKTYSMLANPKYGVISEVMKYVLSFLILLASMYMFYKFF